MGGRKEKAGSRAVSEEEADARAHVRKDTKPEQRKARLATELRANLRRRKAQASARQGTDNPSCPSDEAAED